MRAEPRPRLPHGEAVACRRGRGGTVSQAFAGEGVAQPSIASPTRPSGPSAGRSSSSGGRQARTWPARSSRASAAARRASTAFLTRLAWLSSATSRLRRRSGPSAAERARSTAS
ncbi:MAG: hypothetical protein HOW59_19115 [Nonomuraea sp.]|nr:hypothetical protein [Nonomuraea sp.]